VLDLYTFDKFAFDNHKIQPSMEFIPEWWKNIPPKLFLEGNKKTEGSRASTMRHCPGFIDLFKETFTLPLWGDLIINVDSEKNMFDYDFVPESDLNVFSHATFQRGEFMPDNDFIQLQVESPWKAVSSDTDVNWLMVPAVWNQNEYMLRETTFVPGLLNFKYSHLTNVQLFINNSSQELFFSAGTPLVYLVPLTDREVEINHYYDPEKHSQLGRKSQSFSFVHSHYRKKSWCERPGKFNEFH